MAMNPWPNTEPAAILGRPNLQSAFGEGEDLRQKTRENPGVGVRRVAAVRQTTCHKSEPVLESLIETHKTTRQATPTLAHRRRHIRPDTRGPHANGDMHHGPSRDDLAGDPAPTARNSTMKILLIEDNRELAESLVNVLKTERFTVDWVEDGSQADSILQTESYDAVLLDLLLPHMTGKQILRRLRERHNNAPVLILTASDSLDEKVTCLSAGADDYLVKPFEIRELVARIKALIRRQAPDKAPEMNCGDLLYNTDTRQFFVAGMALALTTREHAVLEILMIRQGKTVSKQTLVNGVFGLQDDPSEDAIEIYVHRLRKKLSECAATITTLRGLGYLLTEKAHA